MRVSRPRLPGGDPVVCRKVAGLCDAAEVCSGKSAACPSDAYKAAGLKKSCPADRHKLAGTSCGKGSGICKGGSCVPVADGGPEQGTALDAARDATGDGRSDSAADGRPAADAGDQQAEEGCSCRLTSSSNLPGVWVLLLYLAWRRRRV